MSAAAIILAAGQGTRMSSDLPKVLHTIGDRPMLSLVIETVRSLPPDRIIVVVGYQADRVIEACRDEGVTFVQQAEQLGTGHAVLRCKEALSSFTGTVVVLNGDVPCLRSRTLREFVADHERSAAAATVLTTNMDDPSGYGRIVRADDGSLLRIVEHKDAVAEELAVAEINSGLFCFDKTSLFEALAGIGRENAQGEYYLTDAIAVLREAGKRVSAYRIDDNREVAGVNNDDELDEVRRYLAGARK